MTKIEALHKAIEQFESQAEFARALAERSGNRKLGPSHVSQWIKRGGLPSRYALHVQWLTKKHGEQVAFDELCPEMGRSKK